MIKKKQSKKTGINRQLWRPNCSTKIRGTYHKTIADNLSRERDLYEQYHS